MLFLVLTNNIVNGGTTVLYVPLYRTLLQHRNKSYTSSLSFLIKSKTRLIKRNMAEHYERARHSSSVSSCTHADRKDASDADAGLQRELAALPRVLRGYLLQPGDPPFPLHSTHLPGLLLARHVPRHGLPGRVLPHEPHVSGESNIVLYSMHRMSRNKNLTHVLSSVSMCIRYVFQCTGTLNGQGLKGTPSFFWKVVCVC